jgi:flavin reductase (DIM6/NTAB) family NADH-FMN oxidoreductase RutF
MEEEYFAVLPEQVETRVLHGYLLGAVGPRPIAFASTVDGEGRPNLAPFSFFNVFSAKPPVLIFSPARRVRDNTTKHTLENVQQTGEVVVNVVTYPMVQQMSLASTEYDRGVNEFEKAGFTMVPSDRVAPYRVGEAPVQFECRVIKVEPLGREGGAGNLIHAEVLKIHIRRAVLDEQGQLDPRKLDLVARMGGDWYSRAAAGLFEVPKPLASLGIGVDAIPGPIRLSPVLTGNDLGLLGNVEEMPGREEVRLFVQGNEAVRELLEGADPRDIHRYAQRLLEGKEVAAAWKVLLASLEK